MDGAPVRDDREDGPGLRWAERGGPGTGRGKPAPRGEGLWRSQSEFWENPGFSLSPQGVGDGEMPSVWRRSLGLLGGEMGNLSRNH